MSNRGDGGGRSSGGGGIISSIGRGIGSIGSSIGSAFGSIGSGIGSFFGLGQPGLGTFGQIGAGVGDALGGLFGGLGELGSGALSGLGDLGRLLGGLFGGDLNDLPGAGTTGAGTGGTSDPGRQDPGSAFDPQNPGTIQEQIAELRQRGLDDLADEMQKQLDFEIANTPTGADKDDGFGLGDLGGLLAGGLGGLLDLILGGGRGGGQQTGGGGLLEILFGLLGNIDLGKLLGGAGEGLRQNELIEAVLNQNFLIPRFKPPIDITAGLGGLGATLGEAGKTSQGLGINF